MNKLWMCVLALAAISFSDIIITGDDLGDIEHSQAAMWRINLEDDFAEAGITVDDVTAVHLEIDNITNYSSYDWNNILYLSLLDMKPTSTTEDFELLFFDNEVGNIDYFRDTKEYVVDINGDVYQGYQSRSTIGSWTDYNGRYIKDDLSFDIDLETFKDYYNTESTGRIGIGFDGDCHFYNDGVKLVVQTSVPEPAMISLLGFGLLGIFFSRKRKK